MKANRAETTLSRLGGSLGLLLLSVALTLATGCASKQDEEVAKLRAKATYEQAVRNLTENRLAPAGRTHTVRLVRNGAQFEATALDGDGKSLATQSVDLPDLAATKGDVGLFVLSHEALLLSKATFSNVQLH